MNFIIRLSFKSKITLIEFTQKKTYLFKKLFNYMLYFIFTSQFFYLQSLNFFLL